MTPQARQSMQWLERGRRVLMANYAPPSLVVERAEGSWVWDPDGRRYLDLVGGIAVNVLGHAHPSVREAVARQVERLIHASNLYATEPQVELAEALVARGAGERIFFCQSGAEANEAAIKLARLRAWKRGETGRSVVVAFEGAFHGRTLGALAATTPGRYRRGFEPLPGGFRHVPFDDLDATARAVGAETCAVLVEPIQGEGGLRAASAEFLIGLRHLCDATGALLVVDEVQTGMGRTGRFFAHEAAGVVPDVVTLAKGLAGGLPLGAVGARGDAAEVFEPGDHGTTFGGNPVTCAAALAVLRTLDEEDLPARARRLGDLARRALEDLVARQPCAVEVRGAGLMLGLLLDRPAAPVVEAAQRRGVLINATAGSVIRLLPALTIDEQDLIFGIEALGAALEEIEGGARN